jgi:hypothetical protein
VKKPLPALVLIAMALAFWPFPQTSGIGPVAALADDDGDDGGDDGGGRGRGSRGGDGPRGFSPGRGTGFFDFLRPRERARRRPERAAPIRFLPEEIVVAGIDERTLDLLAADSFTIVERAAVGRAGRMVARLREPRNTTYAAARTRILAIAPDAIVDLNHVYRTSEFGCPKGACSGPTFIAWPSHGCRARPLIGMIDTGVDLAHPAFAGRAIEEMSVIGAGRKPADNAHGTAIAALLAGAPESRTPGLVPDARVIAVAAFHLEGRAEIADAFSLTRGIDLLVERRVDIVNLSLAGDDNAVVGAAVSAAIDTGIAVVASAGNRGAGAAPAYPAAYPDVIAVTAIDVKRRLYRQAGRGEHLDFAAPGVKLWTAAGTGGRFRSGTSYAAPFVTAALAVKLAHAPDRPLGEIVYEMASQADDLGEAGRDPLYGWGLIQATELCTPVADAASPG